MLNKDIPHFARKIAETYGGSSGSMLLNVAESAGVHVIKNSRVDALKSDENARAYYNGKKWIVIYDDLREHETKNFAVAHELGHIFLKHVEEHARLTERINQLKRKEGLRAERQADIFAEHLLKARKQLRKE